MSFFKLISLRQLAIFNNNILNLSQLQTQTNIFDYNNLKQTKQVKPKNIQTLQNIATLLYYSQNIWNSDFYDFINLKMGNNHDKYFGSDKRKIIILGLQKAGKTTFLEYVSKQTINYNTPKTKNLNIEDVTVDNLQVTFFDMAGGERQRVFWKQQYEGTQGIIFVIDVTSTFGEKQQSLDELEKLNKQFQDSIPLLVAISKIDKVETIEWIAYKGTLTRLLQLKLPSRKSLKVQQIDYKNKEGVKNLLSWLLSQTKPI